MRFDPAYAAHVLRPQFDQARSRLLDPLLRIHYAHLVMLADRAIVSPADARALRDALDALPVDEIAAAPWDDRCEDLFFHVERRLSAACGEDTAGRLHTARSRNDIDMTMYRMRVREEVAALAGAVLDLRAAALDLASRHVHTVMAAHTHTQPAQPTTLAHYLLATIEQLERDTRRLRSAHAAVNRCPLGACAITGTGFPIDRTLTSELLGFDTPTGNTYGSIAAMDDLLEAVAATGVLVAGLGRIVQDLLLWCMPAFGVLRLADGFVQASSVMPQKRNPVALEHARGLASVALGQAQAVTLAVHNTPFGDIVDIEDDLQPLLEAVFRDARRAAALVAAALGTADVDAARLEARAAEAGVTLTELADTLVRDHDLPFRQAHLVAARLLAHRALDPEQPPAQALAAVSHEVLGRPLRYADDRLDALLSARHFVAVRETPGGPAEGQMREALARAGTLLADDRRWLADRREAMAAAEARLRTRSRAL